MDLGVGIPRKSPETSQSMAVIKDIDLWGRDESQGEGPQPGHSLPSVVDAKAWFW